MNKFIGYFTLALLFFIANVDSFNYRFDPKTRTETWQLTDKLGVKRVHDCLENPIEWSDCDLPPVN